jgi:magnesium-transporting ATPase (P-type)
LVDITRKLGISFERREGRYIVLKIGKEKREDNASPNNLPTPVFEYYEVLAQLEFTSSRRRMTTVVIPISEDRYLSEIRGGITEDNFENCSGDEVILFTKGADDMILSRSVGGFFLFFFFFIYLNKHIFIRS